jgi:ribonuclease Y
MSEPLTALLVVVALAVGAAVAFLVLRSRGTTSVAVDRAEAERILQDAETQRKQIVLDAQEKALGIRQQAEAEGRERNSEIQRAEQRIFQREEVLDQKTGALEKREGQLGERESELETARRELSTLETQQRAELERVSGLSQSDARALLMANLERELKGEMAVKIREAEQQTREEADRRSRSIITTAIQRIASEQVSETSVSVVALPSDEIKGRIIGREGRNIRALEQATGVDLIIDDTPEAVILSGFDPVRREIARVALQKLIQDGRIHPGRIEEVVAKAKGEVEARILEAGEEAAFATGVTNLPRELIRLLGSLKYRTSYGQNVLMHVQECAHLAGIMAAELGANVALAKESALLHDIGKAVDHEVEGSHAVIGADILERLGRPAGVIHAVRAHHFDEEPHTVEAVLTIASDAVSAARPGARRETLDTYLKRLEKLEEIAQSFPGVEKSFAIQAGREIRIMVLPDSMDDAAAAAVARDVAKRIEGELQYPGQIKVTVIRETRAVEYAK